MLKYKHYLLFNLPIPLSLENGETIKVKTPSIEEFAIESGYEQLVMIFDISFLDLQLEPELYGFIANDYPELFVGLKRSEVEYGVDKGIKTLEHICGVSVNNNGVFYGDYELTDNDIVNIREIYMKSVNRLDPSESESDFDKEISEYQKKIDRIKGKGNSDSEVEDDSASFGDLALIIAHELKMSPLEIRKLNYYGLIELSKVASIAPYERIESITAGNGLLKDSKSYKPMISRIK